MDRIPRRSFLLTLGACMTELSNRAVGSDTGPEGTQHTLGRGAEQASPGNHIHTGPWVDLPLDPRWQGNVYGTVTPGYRLISSLRMVQFRGTLWKGTGSVSVTVDPFNGSSTVPYVLPESVRPRNNRFFAIPIGMSALGGGNFPVTGCRINSTGQIYMAIGSTWNYQDFVSFDPIWYSLD